MYIFMSSGCYFCQILTNIGSCQRILVTISNIQFHENLPGENGSDTWMDRQRETTMLLVTSATVLQIHLKTAWHSTHRYPDQIYITFQTNLNQTAVDTKKK